MRALVIGASGQVGRALYEKILRMDAAVHGTYNSVKSDHLIYMDMTERNSIINYFEDDSPTHIFIPGAFTNVDLCETNPETGYQVNVVGIKNVVDLAPPESKIIFFSTDFVFDGIKGLYSELDFPNPISEYGKQKLAAEHYIATHAKDFLIVRTNVVFGPDDQEKNFVCRLIKNLQENKTVTIPKDEFGTPTYNINLAEVLLNVVDKRGIVHLSGPKLVSRYRFALEAAEIFGLNTELIKPIFSADLKRPAQRPLSAGLISKNCDVVLMDYRAGLEAMKYRYPVK